MLSDRWSHSFYSHCHDRSRLICGHGNSIAMVTVWVLCVTAICEYVKVAWQDPNRIFGRVQFCAVFKEPEVLSRFACFQGYFAFWNWKFTCLLFTGSIETKGEVVFLSFKQHNPYSALRRQGQLRSLLKLQHQQRHREGLGVPVAFSHNQWGSADSKGVCWSSWCSVSAHRYAWMDDKIRHLDDDWLTSKSNGFPY